MIRIVLDRKVWNRYVELDIMPGDVLVPCENWYVERYGRVETIDRGQMILVISSRFEKGPYKHGQTSLPIAKPAQVPDQDENCQLEWAEYRHAVTGVWNNSLCTVYVYQNIPVWEIIHGDSH